MNDAVSQNSIGRCPSVGDSLLWACVIMCAYAVARVAKKVEAAVEAAKSHLAPIEREWVALHQWLNNNSQENKAALLAECTRPGCIDEILCVGILKQAGRNIDSRDADPVR